MLSNLLKRVKKYGMITLGDRDGRRTKEDYIDLKEDKAHELSDLIFKKDETKESFMKQYTLK